MRGQTRAVREFDGPDLVGGEPSDQRLDAAVDGANKRERVVQRVVQKEIVHNAGLSEAVLQQRVLLPGSSGKRGAPGRLKYAYK